MLEIAKLNQDFYIFKCVSIQNALYGIIITREKEEEEMAASEAQKRASAKYQREKTKQVNLKFSPNEMELYNWLKAQDGTMSGVVKDLIKNEIQKNKKTNE